jgi:hypothetical protein
LEDRSVQAEVAAQAGRPRPSYEDQPGGPSWLRNLIGDELFQQVTEVQLAGTNVYTARVPISDETLIHITSLHELERLILTTTDVSDDDLRQIGRMKQLRYLSIRNAPITDAGLAHLRPLSNLDELNLLETRVTDEGISDLQTHLPNCRILWSHWVPRPQ